MISVVIQCDECSQEEQNPGPIRYACKAYREGGGTVNERTGRAVCYECKEST